MFVAVKRIDRSKLIINIDIIRALRAGEDHDVIELAEGNVDVEKGTIAKIISVLKRHKKYHDCY